MVTYLWAKTRGLPSEAPAHAPPLEKVRERGMRYLRMVLVGRQKKTGDKGGARTSGRECRTSCQDLARSRTKDKWTVETCWGLEGRGGKFIRVCVDHLDVIYLLLQPIEVTKECVCKERTLSLCSKQGWRYLPMVWLLLAGMEKLELEKERAFLMGAWWVRPLPYSRYTFAFQERYQECFPPYLNFVQT